MGAYKGLKNFFGKDIIEVANDFHYSPENILILQGKFDLLKQNHRDTYKAITTCSHNQDTRSCEEYCKDLVASWLFEDYICKELINQGIQINKNGADKNREILNNYQVSANSDCYVSFNGSQRFLEIITDYNGYWSAKGVIDLRDNKLKSLIAENAILLGISTKDNKYFLIEMNGKTESIYIKNHKPYGDKPAYRISCINKMKDYHSKDIANEIQYLLRTTHPKE